MKKSDFIERSVIKEVYEKPLFSLIREATIVHKSSFPEKELFVNTLISYKTGGCGEDCAYCAQSSRNRKNPMKAVYLSADDIIEEAGEAKKSGAGRVCISASWRRVPDNEEFEMILAAGERIREMGLEVCATLGTISDLQLKRIQDAGFSAYNHNLDTSEKYYHEIISTRTYAERLDTILRVQNSGMNCCSGGIIGMGESHDDRIDMLHALADREIPLFTVPLNVLVPIPGTPLENVEPIGFWDLLRVIATARIIMPESRICLAAGRTDMTEEQQTLCFMVGVNAVFAGDKLLTTENTDLTKDKKLFEKLDLKTS
ncbi:MAG: biotin synthase BioB [Marinilabiliales bacterium]|nr:MAG: biotin synthase BioB [Marinilabiliales bacterium]